MYSSMRLLVVALSMPVAEMPQHTTCGSIRPLKLSNETLPISAIVMLRRPVLGRRSPLSSLLPAQLERKLVEAVFFVALAVATAVLHYARGFSSAFASLSSRQAAAAAASNSPLYNYTCLLAAATAAYATARAAACYAATALPPTFKSSSAVWRAALALGLPLLALTCYAGAGYPPLGGSVAVKWIAGNWERNGERDLMWCGRLFALLFFWQAVLAGGMVGCRALAESISGMVSTFRAAASGGAGARAGGARGGGGGKKLDQQQHPQGNGRSSQDKSSSGKKEEGVLPEAGGREKLRPSPGGNGAPGWEKEKEREAPLKVNA